MISINIKQIPVLILLLFLNYSFSLSDSLLVHNETFYDGLTPLDSSQSIGKLNYSIDSIITINTKNLASTNYALGVYSLTHKKWYYQKNINKLLTPASTTKLFTTFAIFNQNGRDFKIITEVYHDGEITKEGVLNGNLYIRGKGDALFSTSDLESLADKVRQTGIKKITGSILADPYFFDEKTERAQYSGDNEVVQHTPPITSLNIDKNTATIIVTATNSVGEAPNVFVIPYSDSHIISNNAVIGNFVKSKPSNKTKQIRRKKKSRGFNSSTEIPNNLLLPDYTNAAGDFSSLMLISAGAGIKIGTKLSPEGKQQFFVNGKIRPNTTYSYQHLLYNPPLSIAGAFKNRLKAGGIIINGGIGIKVKDSLHKKEKLIADFKRPVTDIMNIVNKDSDNYLAEILFKIIGANAGGNDNVADKSRIVIDSIIKSNGIDFKGCVLNDGSGLSRRNLVTANSLIKLLENAYHSDYKDDFFNSFSVASMDGTLRKRFKNSPAENNLRAKTGTLRNVSALAGIVKTMENEELAFAFIFNGPNVGVYKLLENEIGKILSTFYMQEFYPTKDHK